MTRDSYSHEQLILAARLYYLDGLSQVEVGRFVNVSQAKVSRMLALAKERGLVRITVAEYDPRVSGLEQDLARVWDIEAIVIRSVPGLAIGNLRQTIGYFAAPFVAGWLATTRVVAIAGGRTLQDLAERMAPPEAASGILVAQAMGNIDSSPGPYDAVELARILARRWHGSILAINSPAIIPDPGTAQRLLALDQIREVMQNLRRADLALVGVGTLENSVFLERGVLGPPDIRELKAAGAVGEILGRFYDAEGRECPTPYRERVVSLELEALKNIPRRVGVVAGADRTVALRAAIRGGLVNALVIDEVGATALLEGHTTPP
jgi:deoxyribonucleoside regulator